MGVNVCCLHSPLPIVSQRLVASTVGLNNRLSDEIIDKIDLSILPPTISMSLNMSNISIGLSILSVYGIDTMTIKSS